jgi:hypothetical protein
MRKTPLLHWMLLTKRIGNAAKMLPPDWPFAHAGLMATLENQQVWDRDYPKLIRIPAAWHGVSAEPLLGPIDIGIVGGESGLHHRSIDPRWVPSLRDQCARNGIAFHFNAVGWFTTEVQWVRVGRPRVQGVPGRNGVKNSPSSTSHLKNTVTSRLITLPPAVFASLWSCSLPPSIPIGSGWATAFPALLSATSSHRSCPS